MTCSFQAAIPGRAELFGYYLQLCGQNREDTFHRGNQIWKGIMSRPREVCAKE